MDGAVKAIVAQPDGRILIAGGFLTVDGHSRAGVARLAPDGTLDSTFNPGQGIAGSNYVAALALQPDGRILVAGQFDRFDGTLRRSIARLNTDGSLDTTFNPLGGLGDIDTPQGNNYSSWYPSLWSMALAADGKIVVGGRFNRFNATARGSAARLLSDGRLDDTFKPALFTTGGLFFPSDPKVYQARIDVAGNILLAGSFIQPGATPRPEAIARYKPDGTLDLSFFPGFVSLSQSPHELATVKAFALQSDGKIVLGGNIAFNGALIGPALVRLNQDGSVDSSFFRPRESGHTNLIHALLVQEDDSILAAGNFTRFHDTPCANIVRLKPQGLLDESFRPELRSAGPVEALAVATNGSILVGGRFNIPGGETGILRLLGRDTAPGLPRIIAQPTDQRVVPGGKGAFSIGVLGAGLAYQWQFNRTNISGATNDSYVLNSVSTNNTGNYRVVIRNASGAVTSAEARLIILDLAEALDTPGWTWTTGSFRGNAPDTRVWFGQLEVTADGQDAAAAQFVDGPAPFDVSVWLETRVEGPGNLTFQWKLSPAANGLSGGAVFYINGVTEPAPRRLSPGIVWKQETHQIPVGSAILRWQSYGYYGPVYLDQLKFTSGPIFNKETAAFAGGKFQVDVQIATGSRFRFESSPDLLNWTMLTNATATTSLLRLVDAELGNFPRRFYRVVQEP